MEDLASLVRIPSQYGSEEECQKVVGDWMRRLNLQVDTFTADANELRKHPDFTPAKARAIGSEGRPNVCGRWKGKGGGRSLVLAAHIDHLQVGDRTVWNEDPFAAVIRDGRMIGRGVANDKAGVAIMLTAIGILESLDIRLNGDLTALSSLGGRDYGEGESCGLFACALRGYKADAGVYLHPHEGYAGLTRIVVSSFGALTFTVMVSGKRPGVFFEDWKGVNAIEKTAQLIRGLGHVCHEKGVKLNVGSVRGGGRWQQGGIGKGGPILTPDSCTIECRISFDYSHRLGEIRSWVPTAVAKLASSDSWMRTNPPKVEFRHFQCESSAVDNSHPIVRATSRAIASVTHVRPTIEHSTSSSDIRYFTRYAKTPMIKFGPMGGGGDQPNEWVDIREYVNSVKAACLLIMSWCGFGT